MLRMRTRFAQHFRAVQLLSTATADERSAYILMSVIKASDAHTCRSAHNTRLHLRLCLASEQPVKHRAVMMRAGEVAIGEAASELGIFSGYLGCASA